MPSTAVRFIGWARLPGLPWMRVCEGRTWDEAIAAVLADTTLGPNQDLMVLESGRTPEESLREAAEYRLKARRDNFAPWNR